MKIYKCDRCGKMEPEKSQYVRPDGWVTLSYTISSYGSNYICKDICHECAIALKLPKQLNCPEVGERLIELIEEIVQGAIKSQ